MKDSNLVSSSKVIQFLSFQGDIREDGHYIRRPRGRPRRSMEWRWSSSTSAFASCQCAATKPHPCNNAISHMYCLRLFSIQWINHSDLCLRLLANSPWGVCGQNITETAVLSSGDGVTFPDDRFLASSLFSSFGFCLYQFVFSSNFSSNFSKNVCKEQREVWYV